MFRFKHGENEFRVEFREKIRTTRALKKNGILQRRKSQAKESADPPTRRCIDCRIISTKVVRPPAPADALGPAQEHPVVSESEVVIATGMSVCSPTDKYDVQEGQDWALRHAIARARHDDRSIARLHGTPLTPDVTTYLWDAFHKSHTPDAISSRQRGVIRRKGF